MSWGGRMILHWVYGSGRASVCGVRQWSCRMCTTPELPWPLCNPNHQHMYVCAQHGHVFLVTVQHRRLMCISSDAVVNPRLGTSLPFMMWKRNSQHVMIWFGFLFVGKRKVACVRKRLWLVLQKWSALSIFSFTPAHYDSCSYIQYMTMCWCLSPPPFGFSPGLPLAYLVSPLSFSISNSRFHSLFSFTSHFHSFVFLPPSIFFSFLFHSVFICCNTIIFSPLDIFIIHNTLLTPHTHARINHRKRSRNYSDTTPCCGSM